MTCPDCEYHKQRAALWRHAACRLSGTPLPWDADEAIAKAVEAEQYACVRAASIALLGADKSLSDRVVNAIRSRGSVNNENVVALPHSTNYQPEQALRAALEFCRDDNLTDVMVVGYNASGELVVLSSKMSRADGLFMLRMAEDWVLGKAE